MEPLEGPPVSSPDPAIISSEEQPAWSSTHVVTDMPSSSPTVQTHTADEASPERRRRQRLRTQRGVALAVMRSVRAKRQVSRKTRRKTEASGRSVKANVLSRGEMLFYCYHPFGRSVPRRSGGAPPPARSPLLSLSLYLYSAARCPAPRPNIAFMIDAVSVTKNVVL